MEGNSYEVFLSSSKPDVYAGFADHLYAYLTDAGVRTFKGGDDLPIGEEIHRSVPKLIEQSKISVPIFSKGYASNTWRLKELVQMVECWKREKQVIMPIFYDVKPYDVKRLAGHFGIGFHSLERSALDDETIGQSIAAFEEVGRIKGWDMEYEFHGLEGQLVEQVVAEVLHQLNKAYLVDSDLLGSSREIVKMAQGIPLPLEMEGCVCEVFLSFRGSDTRRGFTDHLYTRLKGAGVRTYIKNEDLLTGKENGPDLLRAIEQSKISIVIFSENYVSSRCCLEELAQMVECRKMKGQVIMPIFYHVSSMDLLQGNCRKEAFSRHKIKERVDDEKIRKWEAALDEVGSLGGWNVRSGVDRESSICKKVVARVLSVLDGHLVGIEQHHVEKVTKLLNVESSAVGVVGIYGIDGTGKTTIAMSIYKRIFRLFDGHSFLKSIREGAKERRLKNLRRELISDLLGVMHRKIPVDDGIKSMRSRFFDEKVLIFLDDIEPSFELTQSLGSLGSRIIITTRAEQVLDKSKVFMQRDEALKLFRVHAFGEKPAPDNFANLSKEIVSTIDLLPSTIKNVGSYLFSKSKDVWEQTLSELKNVPPQAVQKQLTENFRGPANTEQSSFKGVKGKYEGNEGRIDNIWSIDDQLKELNSLPDSDIKWSKIGTKILVSDKVIGYGSDGTTVYEGMYELRRAAVKSLVRGHHDVATVEIQNLILSDGHENIVRYHGMEEEQKFVYLALERCICSLDDLIRVHSDSSDNSVFPDDSPTMKAYKIKLDSVRDGMQDVNLWSEDGYPSPELLKLMSDVVSGLSHLHNLGMIHRDIKPQNVLITKNPSFGAKLSDMGISKCLQKDKSSLGNHANVCGTPGWRAPEQRSYGERQTKNMDMFSLGCVLFFCVTRGEHPFGEPLDRDSNIGRDIKDLSRVKFIPEAHDLISRLLHQDPTLRSEASEVRRHPFFWSSYMRLKFLHDVSDKVEAEAKKPKAKKPKAKKAKLVPLKALGAVTHKVESEAEAGKDNLDIPKKLEEIAQLVFVDDWTEKIDENVMKDLRQHRRYRGSSVGDLLRAVRNKSNHLVGAPKHVEAILGSDSSDLDAYFTKLFPKLLIESYNVVSQSPEGKKFIAKALPMLPK